MADHWINVRRVPPSALLAALVPILAAALCVCHIGAANAAFKINAFSVTPSTTQAGGHPNLTINIDPDAHNFPQTGEPCECNDVKDIHVEFPAGLIGNPHATPQCSDAGFLRFECPSDSQVGIVEIWAGIGGESVFRFGKVVPVYNMVPKPSQAGLLAWKIPFFEIPVYTELSARTGSDYGLNALTDGVGHIFSLIHINEELWGVPAEPANDKYRFGVPNNFESGQGFSSDSPLTPFLQNPTTCVPSLSTTAHIRAYDQSTVNTESPWPTTTGCEQLSFNPSLSAQPTTTATDSASGLEVFLSVPQEVSPTTPSPSEIRATTVELPEGFSINPNAADGKTSCSDAEARFGSSEEARCPDYAKVGTVLLESSALPAALPGSIYIGEPTPGNRYRIFVTADGFATHIKLAGTVEPDPVTGRLTVSFPELPQSPLTEINLHFFGSERGLLATPTQCGTYAVHSTFTPWDESLSSQEATQLFSLSSGPGSSPCPGGIRPFGPGFQASSVSNRAGAHSPFFIHLTRPDGDQNLAGVTVSTPPGFSATLKGIPYCSDAALAAAANSTYTGLAEQAQPSCSAASQIGTAVAGAGAGTHPVFLPGKVYLAGPYRGAQLSLAVITPAVSGPYDLGNVVVRAALQVNPETAQVTTVSDPLPQILEGIPLRLRSILVNLDRPNFALNPTNCDPSSINARLTGDQGAVADLSNHFEVANCADLPFAPRFALRFSGSTKRTGDPAVTANVTYPSGSGYANIAATQVTLPDSELIDNSHLQAPCTLKQFAQKACPPSTVIGFAKADTPLLDHPLEGPVYLRNGPHQLPDIVAALSGQIGEIDLVGRVDSFKTRLRSTFETVPDAPISHFTLSLDGGSKGLIESTEGLCHNPQRATVRLVGQNGKVIKVKQKIQLPCAKKSTKHRAGLHGAKRDR